MFKVDAFDGLCCVCFLL